MFSKSLSLLLPNCLFFFYLFHDFLQVFLFYSFFMVQRRMQVMVFSLDLVHGHYSSKFYRIGERKVYPLWSWSSREKARTSQTRVKNSNTPLQLKTENRQNGHCHANISKLKMSLKQKDCLRLVILRYTCYNSLIQCVMLGYTHLLMCDS